MLAMLSSDLDLRPCSGRMEFTEEDLEHSLRNVSEVRRVRALETFRDLERRNAHLNRQRELLKRDMDSFENDLASMGVRRRASDRSSVSQALDPDLWSTLPLELLHLVFAHLPLVDIVRLRALSTTWNRYVIGDMPGFTKVCAEVNPRLFGMIGDGPGVYFDGLMSEMLKGSGTSWHKYCRKGGPNSEEGYDYTMRSGDGGLVCIVFFSQFTRLDPPIVVRNPLTGRDRALPRLPHPMWSTRLWMVQLVMDRDLKCYKVLVLCYEGAIQARVFCSIAGKWRSPEASDGLVFGYRYDWSQAFDDEIPTSRLPCVYDCASGKLVDLDDQRSPWKAPGVLPVGRSTRWPHTENSLINDPTFALVKDRLFVLHMEVQTRMSSVRTETYNRYWISEYQALRRQPYWAKLRDHSCGAFEVAYQEYIMHLYACCDFLLVTANNCLDGAFEHDLAWVYEIATEKWQEIDDAGAQAAEVGNLAMFELQWDAVP